MKSYWFLAITLVLSIACTSDYQARQLSSINITTFSKENTSIRAIYAFDEHTAYFAGSNGDLHVTMDGGKNWNVQNFQFRDSIIPHFRSIASNGKAIFVLSIANPALLYKVEKDTITLVYTEEHPSVFYDAMIFTDENHGIAFGDQTEECISLLITKDGGNTWNKIACDQLPRAATGEAAFAASNTNIKAIGSTIWIATGGMKSRIFKSTDTGNTWEVFDTPVKQGTPTTGIYSIDFADAQHGIAIGGDYLNPTGNIGNKALTQDGGLTWQLIAEGQDPSYKSCVQYVPNTQGKEVFAVGKTGISYSNDGGNTWTEVSKEPFYSIQFTDRNHAWLSGNNRIGKLTLP